MSQAAVPYIVGCVLSILTALFLRAVGLDRDRAVYPVLVIVIAAYYVLFALMGGGSALSVELVALLGFALVAVVGFKVNLWWVVAALAGHGVFDLFHGRLIANPGVPAWWPAWCLSFDVCFAACLAVLLARRDLRSRTH